MINVNIIGVHVKRKTLVNRKQLIDVLGLKQSTFRSYLAIGKIPKAAQVQTASGEMWDLNIALGICRDKPKNS